MNFGAAISEGFRKYATFRGTSTRAEYWYFVLFYFLVSLFIQVATRSGLAALWFLGMLVPLLSNGVRRHHDAGRSGWWMLTSIIPFWNFILLAYPTKYGTKYRPESSPTSEHSSPLTSQILTDAQFRTCAKCNKMALPGQSFCAGCGAPLDAA